MKSFWDGLGAAARRHLVLCMVAIVVLTALAGWWLIRPQYKVLFADLRPQDAAAMAEELDKLKQPYQIGDDGASLLVHADQVHATRLKLMGKDLSLHGAVGLELFNTSDFGMTEFAQKINYQRALQGELTRTILALAEVQDARVHLAMPEQGLFRQAGTRAKAAITLTMREGQVLAPQQVQGIQRLVAAATPGLTPQDVTVVDRRGVALSRVAAEGEDSPPASASSGSRLELKIETEALLVRKANAVLEKAFGPGQALASVDVTLDMDRVKTTTEDVLPASVRGSDSRGVLVKERESTRDIGNAPLDAAARATSPAGASSQRDTEYQVGRRVEQVTGTAGAIRRIQLVAIVRSNLDAAQVEQVRKVLAAAVGASSERNDTVVVQSLHSLVPGATQDQLGQPTESDSAAAPSVGQRKVSQQADHLGLVPLLAFGALAVLGWFLLRGTRRSRDAHASMQMPSNLDEAGREAALRKVRDWMERSAPSLPVDEPASTGDRP